MFHHREQHLKTKILYSAACNVGASIVCYSEKRRELLAAITNIFQDRYISWRSNINFNCIFVLIDTSDIPSRQSETMVIVSISSIVLNVVSIVSIVVTCVVEAMKRREYCINLIFAYEWHDIFTGKLVDSLIM